MSSSSTSFVLHSAVVIPAYLAPALERRARARTASQRSPAPASSRPYLRFAAMVATSTGVMFGLMYLNTYQADHVFFSQTRAWILFFQKTFREARQLAADNPSSPP